MKNQYEIESEGCGSKKIQDELKIAREAQFEKGGTKTISTEYMKDGSEVICAERIEEIYDYVKDIVTYPFEKDFLNLLKEENPFPQRYFYIRKKDKYAFFTMYENRMDLFTYGKLHLYFKTKVIGLPCSLSYGGYITNDEDFLFDYVKSMKGAKLILNADVEKKKTGMAAGETLPTLMFVNRFQTIEEYMGALRSTYRRRIKLAIKACQDMEVKQITDGSIDVYPLYLNTYEKSDYKLEKLEKGFFDKVDGTKLVFIKDGKPRGFVLLRINNERLIFMLCGMDYQYETADLYYYMLYHIVCFAIKNGCEEIDFGQTSEETKMKFGAVLKKKYFYAHHSNFIINSLAGLGKGLLAYHYKFPEYHVFKEDIR